MSVGHSVSQLPSALSNRDVRERLAVTPRIGVFLDYDGTLTPIVARPELALPTPATRSVLADLAEVCVVGIISGRDLDDVRGIVGSDGLWYAGSHGFDVYAPDGSRTSGLRSAAINIEVSDCERISPSKA